MTIKPKPILAVATVFLAQCLAAAASTSFTGAYSQNFDSLGTTGTTMPAGFRALGLAGGNTTYGDATPITSAAIAAATISSVTNLTIWNPGSAAVTGRDTLFNEGSWGNTANRALGTSPTGNAATVIELSMTNHTGGNLTGVTFSYDLKVQTNGASGLPTQLAGYAFFYSITGGGNAADWTKVASLSLANNVQGNTYSSGNVAILFPTALANGGLLYFRWADDNDSGSSPDQMIAIDNLVISLPPAVSVSLTHPAGNATFAQPASLLIEAAAISTSGLVTNVEFYVDGSKIGEDTTAPYSIIWNSPALGAHALTATVRDNLGNTAQSPTNTVNVVSQASVVITRGPYLQLSTPTSIVVRWRTDVATDSRVLYGADTSSLNTTNDTAVFATEHEITLTGLTPDTRYFYAVGTASRTIAGPGTNLYFYTHPLPGTPNPMRVWVIGDAGTGDANQTGVRDAFWTFNGTNRVHAWLQLGDNAYNAGTDTEYQLHMFDIYTNILRNTVTWPTIGNHETVQSYTYADTYPHFLVFSLPTAGQAGGVPSATEHYYSFDYGMVHFICLDSMCSDLSTNTPASGSPGGAGAMAQWLRNDLAATTNRWSIAYWHHPPYTKGSHDSDSTSDSVDSTGLPHMTAMRERFLPILEAGGVDLVLAGHSHVYERTCLAKGHYGLSGTFSNSTMIVQGGDGRNPSPYLKPENATGSPIGNQGTVYAVCGSSGANGTIQTLPSAWTSFMIGSARYSGGGTTHGSMVLDITTNRLDARFITQDGNTNRDWFSIRKDNWAPVASNATINIQADTSTNLVLKGSDINRNPITFSTSSLPTNGLVSAFDPAPGTFTYTPARGATNSDALRFVASDGSLTSTGLVTLTLTPPVDANANGMADNWEAQYGLANPDDDADGDSVNNLQEYWAGTNPTNALSWLRLTAIGTAGAGYQIVWSSVGGTRYRICYSNGDAQGGFNGAFTPIPRPVDLEMDGDPIGIPGTMSFTDDFTLTGGAPPNGARYYRVQVVR